MAGSLNYPTTTPIVARNLTATSETDLLTQMKDILVDAAWATAIRGLGGFVMTGGSPQGFGVSVELYVATTIVGYPSVAVQFRTALGMPGSPTMGYRHIIEWTALRSWFMIACPCNFYFASPNPPYQFETGSAVTGGVPRIPDQCGSQGVTITEVWYSFGDYFSGHGIGQTGTNPRNNIDNFSAGFDANMDGCLNGSLFTVNVAGKGQPQFVRWSHASQNNPVGPDSHPLFAGGRDYLYLANVAWAPAPGGALKIRGQAYNSALRSSQNLPGVVRNWDGYTWFHYTNNYFFGGVWVMLPGPVGGGGNYVY